MIPIRLVPVLCLAAAASSFGQVNLNFVPAQRDFLRDESLVFSVRLSNLSGQTLHLGQEPGWLTFAVESRDGTPILPTGAVDLGEPFFIEAAETALRRVDLLSGYKLSEPGSYKVTATLHLKQWRQRVESKPVMVSIINGVKLQEGEFGISSAGGAPEVRRYSLIQAPHERKLRLYLRLTDARGANVICVYPLGTVVSFAKPETHLDRDSNLHVLFQAHARLFEYCVVDPTGRLVKQERYESFDSRPTMRVAASGIIEIQGGTRRGTEAEIPVLVGPPLPLSAK